MVAVAICGGGASNAMAAVIYDDDEAYADYFAYLARVNGGAGPNAHKRHANAGLRVLYNILLLASVVVNVVLIILNNQRTMTVLIM